MVFNNYPVPMDNLDVIISVGYRVKSKRGTQFRQRKCRRLPWAIKSPPTLYDNIETLSIAHKE